MKVISFTISTICMAVNDFYMLDLRLFFCINGPLVSSVSVYRHSLVIMQNVNIQASMSRSIAKQEKVLRRKDSSMQIKSPS